MLGVADLMADDVIAPLNGSASFETASAESDRLFVNSGSAAIRATRAEKIQGHIDSQIELADNPQGSGVVHVADVTQREGDSLYRVTGVYLGTGGAPSIWTAEYNRGAPRILLMINGTPETTDDYVAYGDNGGVLTVTIAGGDPSTPYTITLSEYAGVVELSQSYITLYGNSSATINLHGRQAGYMTTIYAAEQNSSAASSSISVAVVSVVIEADVVDEPPAGATYASGIDLATLVVKLNNNVINSYLTIPIPYGYRIQYIPAPTELYSGTNTVSVQVRDHAGNETSPDPVTWDFQYQSQQP